MSDNKQHNFKEEVSVQTDNWHVEVHTLNIGQGDGSIIEYWDTTKGKKREQAQKIDDAYRCVLIDGGKSEEKVFNIRKMIDEKKIQIQKMMITHADTDHYVGTIKLLKLANQAAFFECFFRCLKWIKEKGWGENDKDKIVVFLYIHCFDVPGFDADDLILDPSEYFSDDDFLDKPITIDQTDSIDNFVKSYVLKANFIFNVVSVLAILKLKKTNTTWSQIFNDEDLKLRKCIQNHGKFITSKELSLISLTKRCVLHDIEVIISQGTKINFSNIIKTKSDKAETANIKGFLEDLGNALDGKIKIDSYTLPLRNLSRTEKLVGQRTTGPQRQVVYDLKKNLFNFDDSSDQLANYQTQKVKNKPGLYLVCIDGVVIESEPNQTELTYTLTNASSIGLLLVYKDLKYLTCGDIEDKNGNNVVDVDISFDNSKNFNLNDIESQLALKLNGLGYANLTAYKLGHHGGAHATSTYVLNTLSPEMVFISCSNKYSHHHPTREVIFRLYASDVQSFFFTNCAPRYGVLDSWASIEPQAKADWLEYYEKGRWKNENKEISKEDDEVQFLKTIFDKDVLSANDTINGKSISDFLYDSYIKGTTNTFLRIQQKKIGSTFKLKLDPKFYTKTGNDYKLKSKAYYLSDKSNVNYSNKNKTVASKVNDLIVLKRKPSDIIQGKMLAKRKVKKAQRASELDDWTPTQFPKGYKKRSKGQVSGVNVHNLDYISLEKASQSTNDFLLIFEGLSNAQIPVKGKENTEIGQWSFEQEGTYSFDKRNTFIDIISAVYPVNVKFNGDTLISECFKNIDLPVQLKELQLSYSDDVESESEVSLALEFKKTIDLLNEKVVIKNWKLFLNFSPRYYHYEIVGEIDIDSNIYELNFCPDSDDQWLFSILFEKDGASLVSSAKHFLGSFEEPDHSFLSDKKSQNANVDVSLKRINLFLETYESFKISELSFESIISFSCFKFQIAYTVYPFFEMEGFLVPPEEPKDQIDLETVLGNYGITTFDKNFNPQLTSARFYAKPSARSYSVSFGLGQIAKFKIGNNTVSLDELDFNFTYNDGEIEAGLGAEILIKESEMPKNGCNEPFEFPAIFQLKASYSGSDKSWFFSGGLTGNINLSDLLQKLKEKFGVFGDQPLPEWANDWHLKHAFISFQTGDESNLKFEIDIFKEDEEFSLFLEKGKSQWEIKAKVIIGSSQFIGDWKVSKDETSLDLKWDSTQEKSVSEENQSYAYLSMLELASHFGIDTNEIPSELDVQFKSARLKYEHSENTTKIHLSATTLSGSTMHFFRIVDSNKDKKDSIYFTEVKFGDTINLSNLPLIGDKIDSISDIAIANIRAELASKAVPKNADEKTIEGKLLKQIQEEGLLEKEIDEKLKVEAEFQMGSDKHPVKFSVIKFNEKEQSLVGDSKSPESSISWYKIQKAIGPIGFEKIGVKYGEGELWFLLSASLSIGGLKLDMLGLGLGVRLSDIKDGRFKPSFTLAGIGLNYHSSGLSLGGSFLKEPKKEGVDFSYDGSLMLTTRSLSLELIGEYSQLANGHPSLFVFGKLGGNLGGTPAFSMKAIGAGVGYNSSLKYPKVEEVDQFPFIKVLEEEDDLKKDSLKEWIVNKPGSNWFAAGMAFNTYKLIDGEMMLLAQLDEHLEIYILGFASAEFPRTGKRKFAKVDLLLKAMFKPHEGVLGIDMRLGKESFVIDPECHLTGGMSMYTWFGDNKHAGEFVLSIGGYHPEFVKPSHFPSVPRLGFSWKISDHLQLSGSAYFAMTPKELMAGYDLRAGYHSSRVQADFHNYLNVLVQYSPFYFKAEAGVSISVSVRIGVGWFSHTFRGSVSADLHLWGPPTGGVVKFSVCKISTSIHFGKPEQKAELKHFFDSSGETPDFISLLGSGENLKEQKEYLLSLKPLKGLIKEVEESKEGNSPKIWIIQSDSFEFEFASKLPLTDVELNKTTQIEGGKFNLSNLEIGSNASTSLSISVSKEATESNEKTNGTWKAEMKSESLPTALWTLNKDTKELTEKHPTKIRCKLVDKNDNSKGDVEPKHLDEDNVLNETIPFPAL